MQRPEPVRLVQILVVDDEESLRHMLGLILRRAGYEVIAAADGREALKRLEENPGVRIALCDVRMPALDGIGFLERVRAARPEVLVIMMSAYGTMDTALDAMKRGAYDYVSKPFRPDEIVLTLRKAEERERLARENEVLRAEVGRQQTLYRLVGADQGLRRLAEAARKVADTPVTILLTGESGTGKEVVARTIHAISSRSERAFVAVNCSAIPESLLESELFGHEKGAFTGAVRARAGLFEQAGGGTLLLDEVGEMPLALQVKLLRVIEEGRVRRLGGSGDVEVDVRLMAATARPLADLVARGQFREDLYYRLNVFHLHLPPLRERTEDIPLLVAHFLAIHAARLGRPEPRISAEALQVLERYGWPGNVRQLENACERAIVLCDGGVVDVEDLPAEVLEAPVAEPGRELDESDLSVKRRVARLERDLIERALARTEGNRSQAARLLDLSYKALVYKIRDYGLER